MLKAGIVGLPNVGKSTLFNAVTRTRKAEAANYPFCTIDPNVGVVNVPDARLEVLSKISGSAELIPASVEFVDIAGLVKGASTGEGLGNKFLSHIREVDAIVHVVRCFEDDDIHHVEGNIDPVRDIETISTELILTDLDAVQRRRDKLNKEAKRGDKEAVALVEIIDKIEPHLGEGKPAITCELSDDDTALAKRLLLLSAKPTLFAANLKDSELADAENNPYIAKIRDYAGEHHGCETVAISAQIESELADLPAEEAAEFLAEMGVSESGAGQLIHKSYSLLGLQTYFTTGEKETRAWTIHIGDTAPKAAGVIHGDFERGFIKAETVSFADLTACGSIAAARDKGVYRMEGKEYVVQEGDVMLFKFNV
ncbi:MAG: redox-regulated ATPase YchF [Verrucomicrobia bacterium]|nr:redox-regulated ATPase YchF [Verrucomicrobiota bacterium]